MLYSSVNLCFALAGAQSACYVLFINMPQALLPRQINGKYRKCSGKTVKEVIKVIGVKSVIVNTLNCFGQNWPLTPPIY